MLKSTLLCLSIALAGIGPANAQTPAPATAPPAASAIKRTPLEDVDFPAGYHVVTVIAEIAAGTASAGRHTHPGVDTGYVLEGSGAILVEGKSEQILKPGDSYQVPPGVPHDVRVDAGKPLKLLAVYIVEKGKPVATPAPLK
ncbi:MAG: cupin domain-containing protein [Xanthobacteraceae bacterium]|nr:cupin domain-containing protein [Xanthobacteraceae bacterium]